MQAEKLCLLTNPSPESGMSQRLHECLKSDNLEAFQQKESARSPKVASGSSCGF